METEAKCKAVAAMLYRDLRGAGAIPAEMCMVAMYLIAFTANDSTEYVLTPELQRAFWDAIAMEVAKLQGAV